MPIYTQGYSIYSAAEVIWFLLFPWLQIWPLIFPVSKCWQALYKCHNDTLILKGWNYKCYQNQVPPLSPWDSQGSITAWFTHPSRGDVEAGDRWQYCLSPLWLLPFHLLGKGDLRHLERVEKDDYWRSVGAGSRVGEGMLGWAMCRDAAGIILLLISFHQ